MIMKEELLKALRSRIEYPNEYRSTKYDKIWREFLHTDEYKSFIKSNYTLYNYLFNFMSDLDPNFSKNDRAQVVSILIRIILEGPFSLPNIYIKLLNTYKINWVPSNKKKFELLMASLEQQLNDVLSNNKSIYKEEQLENTEDEILENELDLSKPLKDESLVENQTEQIQTEEFTSQHKEKPAEELASQETEEIEVKWNHLDIEDGPDKHEENDHKGVKNTYGPFTLIGARVRGKKHKHEGTNCDDWFAMDSVGKWNIIAASDGAGSKKYSRVGAKVSSEAAVEFLKEQLENCNLQITDESNDFLRDPENYKFTNKDLAYIEKSLHTAFFKAYNAVEQAVKERMDGEEASVYREILNRDLEVNDLSCTLLLAVQTMVNGKSFILACQIGDGATVAITENPNHPVFVLGLSDGGQYSGETDFLTSRKFEKENYLLSRTYPCYGIIRALMVMTDGVADDYFPANEFMNLLYEDLCNEKIIVNADEEDYEAQAERLKYWLDSYQVRGSFDDRTLVVLYKGDYNE